VALGKIAAQTLLRDTTPITRLRGRWSAYEGVKLMPTFHPAYLLRSPEEKKKAWEDLQLVTAFAAQAAVALENSRLYQETQRAYEELSETQDPATHGAESQRGGRQERRATDPIGGPEAVD